MKNEEDGNGLVTTLPLLEKTNYRSTRAQNAIRRANNSQIDYTNSTGQFHCVLRCFSNFSNEPQSFDAVSIRMNTKFLVEKFERIGARLKVVARTQRRTSSTAGLVNLDIVRDRRGEYFEIAPQRSSNLDIAVLDIQSADRHLLLLVREENWKNKYLCGHDERHWFVAGIPETASVGTVRQAMEALQPREVRSALARHRVAGNFRNRRKNSAFVRQGEWFFLPVDNFIVDQALVLNNEPIRRGNGGKPHWVDFCYRTGGESVQVCDRHPNGVTEIEFRKILAANSRAKNWGWRTMRRNPGVYVLGRVRHPDHATITLHVWHQVVMNTENESRGMRNVAFLD